MKLLRNARTLITQPRLTADYLRFLLSRVSHGGEAVRVFGEDRLEIAGFSGFGEFHSCSHFLNPAERQFLSTHSFEDGLILDVGGNLGLFSLLLARRFPERVVHAFEPNPSTFAAMRTNFARNGCSHLHAHALAVAAHDGEVPFQVDSVNRATTHIAAANDVSIGGPPVINVSCVTLDSFVAKERIGLPVGLLKVDVEGYEELVFRGAERLLADGQVRVIYYEVCPELTRGAGLAPETPGQQLLAHGYRLHVLDDNGQLQPVELARVSGVTLENWVATRP